MPVEKATHAGMFGGRKVMPGKKSCYSIEACVVKSVDTSIPVPCICHDLSFLKALPCPIHPIADEIFLP